MIWLRISIWPLRMTKKISKSNMTNEEKAMLYDKYLRQAETLQREVSKIKSENPINVPVELQLVINENNMKISVLETKVRNLFV